MLADDQPLIIVRCHSSAEAMLARYLEIRPFESQHRGKYGIGKVLKSQKIQTTKSPSASSSDSGTSGKSQEGKKTGQRRWTPDCAGAEADPRMIH